MLKVPAHISTCCEVVGEKRLLLSPKWRGEGGGDGSKSVTSHKRQHLCTKTLGGPGVGGVRGSEQGFGPRQQFMSCWSSSEMMHLVFALADESMK